MNLTLVRDLDNGLCTQGTLKLNGSLFQSLERPWLPGEPGGIKGVSCVPLGLYQLVLHDTEAHPRSFALVNPELSVYHMTLPPGKEGRTACLIHVANFPEELRGCIALGMGRDLNRINQSKIAIDQFYALVPWVTGHTLEIAS